MTSTPDAQPRPSLRHQQGAVRRTRRGIRPWVAAGRTIQKDRFGPRVGFAYALNDRTVIRGGTRKVLRGRLRPGLVVDGTLRRRRDQRAGRERRPSELCREPVERQSGSRRTRKPCGFPASGSPCRRSPRRGCRFPTAISRRSACSGRSARTMSVEADYREQRQPGRAVPAEHQSDLQPGHRGEQRLDGRRAGGVPRLGHGERVPLAGMVEFSRAGNGVHEALQSAVAGCRARTRSSVYNDGNTSPAPLIKLVEDLGTSIRWPSRGPAASRGCERDLGRGHADCS